MKLQLVLLFAVFSSISSSYGYVCTPKTCANSTCPTMEPCPSDYRLVPPNLCRCCPECQQVLGLNSTCELPLRPLIPIIGPKPLGPVCDEGLACVNGTCQKKCHSP